MRTSFPMICRIWGLWLMIVCWGATTGCVGQQKEPWTKTQLLAPATLAAQLNGPQDQLPIVIDIGPAGVIKGALEAGPAQEKEGLSRMKLLLSDVPKTKEIVIYCGCCPFAKCPNVRPAFQSLKDMGFKDPRLLNLSHNLKADWIDQGYPLAGK